MTLEQYATQASSKPFFGNTPVLSEIIPNFIKEDNFQTVLAAVMVQLYGEYKLLDRLSKDNGAVVPQRCDAIYALNAFKYQKLYDSTLLDFDPIENYNMTETSTEKQTGHNEVTADYGQETTTTKYGQQSSNQTFGGQDIKHNVSPDNSTGYVAESQDVSSNRSDSVTVNEHSDEVTNGGHTDITSGDDSRDITRELTRKGNIGVTSSVQLAEQFRNYADFSLYKIIASDLKNEICNGFLSVSECVDY